ncbi:MAG: hypothetical protein IJJ06_05835 [Mogibacterium sp.]|nr:hypothetical protein [Mogibacterium sp.]
MKGKIIACTVCALTCCCLYTHRRVIKALINNEPMPKAPEWHFWVKPEGRR